MSKIELRIERIGARGDGVARRDGKIIHVPYTAPGDLVRIKLDREGHAGIVALLEAGARQTPPCPHFGLCGGCVLQHLADDAYARAKENLVREALAHRGLGDVEIAPIRRISPGTRRRARLGIAKGKDGSVRVGIHQRATRHVVDIETCFVLHPKLVGLIPALRSLAALLLSAGEDAAATMTLADTGIDLLLELKRSPDLAALETFADFASAHDLARMSWKTNDEAPTPAVLLKPVQIAMSGVTVDLSPESFLQASREAEAVLTKLVAEGIGDTANIADLYCGLGTFSFALALRARIHAVDGNKPAIAALEHAARRAKMSIATEIRDLEINPLRADELNEFAAAVFDPPFAGAKAQARELAKSHLQRIVAVSCNPATFARDARTLIDGGYRIARIIPVDQFVWSAEIELVAWFER